MSSFPKNNESSDGAQGDGSGKGVAARSTIVGTNTSFIPIPAEPAFCDNYKCKKCNSTTKDDFIKCQTCERLVHGQCEGLASKQVRFLNMFKDDIPYFCKECRYIIKSHLGFLVKSCGDHLDTVEESVTNIDVRIQDLETNTIFKSKTEF